jgi:hypothetical protein
MSIMPMGQGKDQFSPEKYKRDLNKGKQYAAKAINSGIAGAFDIAGMALPGPDNYTGHKDDISPDPVTAIVRFLYNLGIFGKENRVGTQVYSTDQPGSPGGTAVPKGTVDVKEI